MKHIPDCVKIGDYRFTDGTYAAEPIPGKTIVGVVCYIQNKLIYHYIGLEETHLPIDLSKHTPIFETNHEKCKNLSYVLRHQPTVSWCLEHSKRLNDNCRFSVNRNKQLSDREDVAVFRKGFVEFLPLDEYVLSVITLDELEIVNQSLLRVNAKPVALNNYYWTSTERSTESQIAILISKEKRISQEFDKTRFLLLRGMSCDINL